MVYDIQLASRFRTLRPDPARKLSVIPPIIIMNKMYENQNLLYIVPPMRLTVVVWISSINPIVIGCFICVNINRLKPKNPYMGRTAPLTSKRCILYIYSTNICTEYFKHAIYSPFLFSSKCSLFHNANFFGSCIIHIVCTACAKI